jgi:hypothetical protein
LMSSASIKKLFPVKRTISRNGS